MGTNTETFQAFLARSLHEDAILLDNRSKPRSRGIIDHIVIAPSGIWVLQECTLSGSVEVHGASGRRRANRHLYIGGSDESKRLRSMRWQVYAVVDALASTAFESEAIAPVLCLLQAEHSLVDGNEVAGHVVDGVFVTWPDKLPEQLNRPGRLNSEAISVIGSYIREALPAHS